ncbi:hypothetical protein [Streptomyces sp. ISL-11]|uniref:hypothetical protein n=1 Tax=Streptomyces sp. ISL-11 TaxID=2819174 RepID=UPI001BECA68A|nr:hypothetical protein [Streptomyces sp. ISL-11]MBT2384758.1 hypothetical protein [Streptomyces sp. ISL-11]
MPATPPTTAAAPPTVPRRGPARTAAAAACLVLGVGLIGGAAAGSWLAGAPDRSSAAQRAFAQGRTLWRTVPVDEFFPRTLHLAGAGPGGADRDWTRVGVAPDSGCDGAFDPLLRKALAPAGCARLLRATYTDATSTTVTTVGLLVTATDDQGMRALRRRFSAEHLDERTDLMPRPYAPPDTVAERFGDAQRASWRITVLTDAPAVVYAVTGFADARTGTPPQPAGRAVAPGATTAPAQAGLGHEATALAGHLERTLREALRAATEESAR